MKPSPQSPERKKRLRWTINAAAQELGRDRRTVGKALASAGIRAGRDGKYSTLELLQATQTAFADGYLAKISGQADRIERDNNKASRGLLEMSFAKRWIPHVAAMVQAELGASGLSEAEKAACIEEMERFRNFHEFIPQR